jgi:phosphate-selective porin
MIQRRFQFLVPLLFVTIALLSALPSRTNGADSESERLARLEAAVQALQSQNAELKREIASLKNEKPKTAATAQTAVSPGNNKSFVEHAVAEEQPLYVTPSGKETKLVLGGFVQGQFEAGDISAYAGRLSVEKSKTKDRFRLRLARIKVDGSIRFGPVDVVAEYLNQRVRPGGSSATATFDAFRANGYYVTGGYYVLPKNCS